MQKSGNSVYCADASEGARGERVSRRENAPVHDESCSKDNSISLATCYGQEEVEKGATRQRKKVVIRFYRLTLFPHILISRSKFVSCGFT